MARKNGRKKCCPPMGRNRCGCKVESVVSVDERGQMILPKEIREKAGIQAGDKLTVVTWEKDGQVSCISLIKAEDFAGMVKSMLGPMMSDMMAR